jgi:hypothetical protein
MAWRYTREEVEDAISRSYSWAETLRLLGLRAAGGNFGTLKKYATKWGIATDHFDPYRFQRTAPRSKQPTPLEDILVEGSTYSRNHLKERLFSEGVKARRCEICGQGETWRGRLMALILDHINGVGDDHRLENLRIVCPNCAATFDTHCGRKNLSPVKYRRCARCQAKFIVRYGKQRYCSRQCGIRWDRSKVRGRPQPHLRRVDRPTYMQLLEEIEELGYEGTGRTYGVSGNAIRKWERQYERELDMGDLSMLGNL